MTHSSNQEHLEEEMASLDAVMAAHEEAPSICKEGAS